MLLPWRHQGQELLQEVGSLLVQVLRWMVSENQGGGQLGIQGPWLLRLESCLQSPPHVTRTHLQTQMPPRRSLAYAVQRLGLHRHWVHLPALGRVRNGLRALALQ